MVCLSRHRGNRHAGRLGGTHVKSQHTVLEGCHHGDADRHGVVHQGTATGGQEREDCRPRHLLAGHQEQRRCRERGRLHRVEEHQGREAACPCHRRTDYQEPEPGGTVEEGQRHIEDEWQRRKQWRWKHSYRR